jgi:hypothetical protein
VKSSANPFGSPCWCGSGLFMFIRTLVRGRVFLTCSRCCDWKIVQASKVWDDIAQPEDES